MSSAARKRACRAACRGNYAKLRKDGGGFCVHCFEPSPVEEMDWLDDRDDTSIGDFTAECPHCIRDLESSCPFDVVLPFSALPRNPIERRVLLRWCHNDRFRLESSAFQSVYLGRRLSIAFTEPRILELSIDPEKAWRARRELQRAGRYVLFAKRLERAYFEAMDRRYAPGSVGETEAMLSFRAAAAAPPAAGAAA